MTAEVRHFSHSHDRVRGLARVRGLDESAPARAFAALVLAVALGVGLVWLARALGL